MNNLKTHWYDPLLGVLMRAVTKLVLRAHRKGLAGVDEYISRETEEIWWWFLCTEYFHTLDMARVTIGPVVIVWECPGETRYYNVYIDSWAAKRIIRDWIKELFA